MSFLTHRWRRAALIVAVIAALVAAVIVSGDPRHHKREAPALPSAVLVPPRTTLHSLSGEPAALVFWASWCGPCHDEAPQFERLARRLHGARLVGIDWSDGLGGARSFLRRYGWSFPVLRDADGTAGDSYGISGLPTTFILDSRGRIYETLRGPQTAADVRAALRRAS